MPIDNSLLEKLAANDADLTELDLSYRNLSLGDIQALATALSQNTSLLMLNVAGNPLREIGAELLANTELHLKILIASDCKIKSAKPFAKTSKLEKLDLSSNSCREDAGSLGQNKSLKWLSLAGVPIGDEGAEGIAQSNSIVTAILTRCEIGARGGQALALNKSIEELNLAHNHLQTAGSIPFAENSILKSLSLRRNQVGAAAIIALATSSSTQIKYLDIADNQISDEAFATLVSHHPTLTEIDAGYNQLTVQSTPEILANTRLTKLTVCYNPLGDLGVMALARHTTIDYLDVSGVGAGYKSAFLLSQNLSLRSLFLSSNRLGDIGGVMLAPNKSLKKLYLSYNSLGDGSEMAFANNTTLDILNLNYNLITESGRATLRENTSIPQLIVSKKQPPNFTDENLDNIFYLAEDFLCISDLTGTLEFFNPAFLKALGYTNDEMLAKSSLDFLHPDDKEQAISKFSEEHPTTFNFENRYRCKDGAYRTIAWKANIRHHRLYTVGNDITDQRLAQREILHQQTLVAGETLRASLAYSQRLNKFISKLSHEIRNPLSGVIGLRENLMLEFEKIEVLVHELHEIILPPAQASFDEGFGIIAESFGYMFSCTEYLKALLNNKLDIARMQDAKFVLENQPFDLKKAIKLMVGILQVKAQQKGVLLHFKSADENAVWVKGDMLRFEQIIMNLVSNALKFTSHGRVDLILKHIITKQEYVFVDLDICDTGIGISLEGQNKLFQSFSQLSPSTGSHYGGGSGLGLYLAKEIANAMKGDITVKSEIGKGSVFSFTAQFEVLTAEQKLENSTAVEEFQESKSTPDPNNSSAKPSIGLPHIGIFRPPSRVSSRRILVVDDNIINQKVLTRMLESAGHKCKVAGNGLAACFEFEMEKNGDSSNGFDLILMDITMPIMNGIEATQRIRLRETEKKALNHWSRTPIWGISANSLPDEMDAGLAAGMDRYFAKPYDTKELIKLIAALPIRGEPLEVTTLPPLPSPLSKLRLQSCGPSL